MARHPELYDAILRGKRKDVARIVQEQIDAGADVEDLLNNTMIAAMRECGDKFSRGEVYVPEMLIAARAMNAGLVLIEPMLVKAGHKAKGKVCIGTVKGDLHDIGKNLVAMMMKGAGYEVTDLGTDCDADRFVEAANGGAQVIMLSALLTTTMPYMKTVVEKMAGKKDVKIVVGGAPITQEYADEIGAHGFGVDANDAVKVVDRLLQLAS